MLTNKCSLVLLAKKERQHRTRAYKTNVWKWVPRHPIRLYDLPIILIGLMISKQRTTASILNCWLTWDHPPRTITTIRLVPGLRSLLSSEVRSTRWVICSPVPKEAVILALFSKWGLLRRLNDNQSFVKSMERTTQVFRRNGRRPEVWVDSVQIPRVMISKQ